jgi:hypothetical protein
MLEEPLVMFALGFVSVEEFVSLAQLISLLLNVLLLFGVDNRCVRNFSSRRHFALLEFLWFLVDGIWSKYELSLPSIGEPNLNSRLGQSNFDG